MMNIYIYDIYILAAIVVHNIMCISFLKIKKYKDNLIR